MSGIFGKSGKLLSRGIADLSFLQSEAKQKQKIENQIEDQYLCAMKLAEWEIANGIAVEAVLRKPFTPSSVEFHAVRYFHKMTEEEKNEYIKRINLEKYEHDKYQKLKKEGVSGQGFQDKGGPGSGNSEGSGRQPDAK